MTTLRARLFIGLTGFILLFCAVAGFLSYRWAFDIAIELQDATLAQVASLTAAQPQHPTDAPPDIVDAEAKVIVEEMGVSSVLFPADLSEGFHIVNARGQPWRVMVRRRDDGSRVAVAQPTAQRDEIAEGTALRTLIPIVALIPCLMIVVAVVVHWTFRPLSPLAGKLDAGRIERTERLEEGAVPGELRPFMQSINRLLDRLEASFHQQRRFIAEASHELRSPITALSLQVQNIDGRALPPEEQARVSQLNLGMRRVGRLLDQLLTLARFEAPRSEKGQVAALEPILKTLVSEFMPMADAAGVDLGFEAMEALSVEASAFSVEVLARNLIENALKYTPVGGRVDLAVTRQGDRVFLHVKDTGPGVPEPDLSRLFEPFFRGANAAGEGNGLGLSIVRRIIDQGAGTIEVCNRSGAGETGLHVTVTFELARSS